ncbi:AcrR family transcriptional regulator [Thermocatellispora tengchongensis]|uniref:AcrR family transcriptional regulator n=2 Tax=Thermocatellispora tengchongensis TaxID=1073253 RepID=A0A840P8R2_9ACTN|nr:TetR/AcrR family transcriptional regulator [Thermocatellispora tengchongensis]MBB5136058.1 AcrR family transcriptional regulator [Thermocatellispora tengchongensis]
MAARRARPRPQASALVDDETDEEFWGSEYPPVARSLLTSAVACFAEKGFEATTTRDIGTGAGLSTAALYVHFPSKEEALFAIMRIGHQRALEALGPQAARDGADRDPVTAMADLVRGLVGWHARHHTVARVCQFELTALTPEHYRQIIAVRKGITDVFRFAVSRGVAAGVFDVDDVNRVVRAILSLGVDLVRWYRLDGADSPDKLAEVYAGLALRMLGVR